LQVVKDQKKKKRIGKSRGEENMIRDGKKKNKGEEKKRVEEIRMREEMRVERKWRQQKI